MSDLRGTILDDLKTILESIDIFCEKSSYLKLYRKQNDKDIINENKDQIVKDINKSNLRSLDNLYDLENSIVLLQEITPDKIPNILACKSELEELKKNIEDAADDDVILKSVNEAITNLKKIDNSALTMEQKLFATMTTNVGQHININELIEGLENYKQPTFSSNQKGGDIKTSISKGFSFLKARVNNILGFMSDGLMMKYNNLFTTNLSQVEDPGKFTNDIINQFQNKVSQPVQDMFVNIVSLFFNMVKNTNKGTNGGSVEVEMHKVFMTPKEALKMFAKNPLIIFLILLCNPLMGVIFLAQVCIIYCFFIVGKPLQLTWSITGLEIKKLKNFAYGYTSLHLYSKQTKDGFIPKGQIYLDDVDKTKSQVIDKVKITQSLDKEIIIMRNEKKDGALVIQDNKDFVNVKDQTEAIQIEKYEIFMNGKKIQHFYEIAERLMWNNILFNDGFLNDLYDMDKIELKIVNTENGEKHTYNIDSIGAHIGDEYYYGYDPIAKIESPNTSGGKRKTRKRKSTTKRRKTRRKSKRKHSKKRKLHRK